VEKNTAAYAYKRSYGVSRSCFKNQPGNFLSDFGITLIIAALLLWIKTDTKNNGEISENTGNSLLRNGFLGGGIGFLSGLVGIGGGIFLSPLLNLMKWDTQEKLRQHQAFLFW
jgi:uncharacterized membrane protein YfcA